ncbi:carbohydrate-binding module family 20 domain-containing protein [Catenovulum sediminis]|uniref:1,4-alpha-glucan branching enzyme n=1 Tax=Catenovulum sediminis TaxID=1740262 RepID=A0ABV1RBT6_9ALTE
MKTINSIIKITALALSLSANCVQADAWLNGDENAIWQMSPGVYKEGNSWYVIFHAAAGDSNVSIYGDFTQGESGAIPLTKTPDGHFWWFKGTDQSFAQVPQHGDEYRFKLTRDGQEMTFQDPAARWVSNSELGSGMSKIYLSDAYQWQSTGWQRPVQEQLNIYQVHPLRFTDRNSGTPFQQVTEELDGDGTNDYINNLNVTALELLPVNEFAGDLSWGYNPSFFYAVESSYGGPDQLKKLVDTAHQNGIAVILDLEFNHVASGDNILWTVDNTTYMDGDTVWGPLYNFNDPVAKHFLIQNVLYLAQEFKIDGFRFDHTNTIHNPNSGFVTQPGDGGGWDLLREMYGKTKQQDSAIWFTGEELPDWWGITSDDTGTVVEGTSHAPMDSQWVDTFHDNFKAVLTGGSLDLLWSVFGHFGDGWQDATVYTESHDEVGNTDDRIAKRARDGKGWEMNQISLAGTVLARGTPMAFMGQEGGETRQFHIDWWDDRLDLSDYETNAGRKKVLAWYSALNAIRAKNPTAFASGDSYIHHIHDANGVAAFSRNAGEYVIVMNFKGNTYQNYDIGVTGNYAEIANTSWTQFNLGGVPSATRGEGVAAQISNVHIPAYGAVVLQRVDPVSSSTSIDFTCQNGTTVWGQNVYVVGNQPEIGNWNAANAVKLDASAYPTWTGTISDFPANTNVQWKCIKRDVGAVEWQSGANNSVNTPASGSVSSVGQF